MAGGRPKKELSKNYNSPFSNVKETKTSTVLATLEEDYVVTEEPLEDPLAEEESYIITLRCTNPKKQYDVIRPVTDKNGNLITGQKFIPESMRKEYPRVVDEFTEKILSNPTKLDLRNEVDRIDWGWMKSHPYIVESEERALQSSKPVWYIDNPKKTAHKAVKEKKSLIQLQARVFELSLNDKRAMMRILGEESSILSEDQVDVFLTSRIEEEMRFSFNIKVARLLDDEADFKRRKFAYAVIDAGIVEETEDGIFYNNKLIADGYDNFLLYIGNKANVELVSLWKTKV